jgi:hypothetical protein
MFLSKRGTGTSTPFLQKLAFKIFIRHLNIISKATQSVAGLTAWKVCIIIDFRFSKWFTADMNSALGYWHHVDVGSIADISEVHAHAVFMFRDPVNKMSESHRQSGQGKFISSCLQEPIRSETYAYKNTNSVHLPSMSH